MMIAEIEEQWMRVQLAPGLATAVFREGASNSNYEVVQYASDTPYNAGGAFSSQPVDRRHPHRLVFRSDTPNDLALRRIAGNDGEMPAEIGLRARLDVEP